MGRLDPLPEHIPLVDREGITRRWIGWFRTVHQKLGQTIDTDVLSAFADINTVDPQIAEDQARLSLFGSAPDSGASELQELKRLAATVASVEVRDVSPLETLLALLPGSRSWSEIAVIADTAANAAKYPALAYALGSLRFETDTEKLYLQIAGAWVQLIAPALLQFLGTSSSYPALKRSGAILQVRLADDSDYSALEVLDEAYGAGWDGKVEVTTKNAVYDKVQAVEAEIATKADAQAPAGAPHAIPLLKLTGGGSDGSITVNAQGVITAFVDPT